MQSDQIRQLASECGIAPDYEDAWGNQVSVDHDVLVKLLNSFGALEADGTPRGYETGSSILPPVIVVCSDGHQVDIDLSGDVPATMVWELILEGGHRRRGEAKPQRTAGGTARLALSDVPFGYHRLTLDPVQAASVLIVTPKRCWLPDGVASGGRSFGIALQLYLLRSTANWGIGDFGDLARFATLAADHGCDIVGLNPLHQMFPDTPEHASPYSPANRLFVNVLYIDVAAIPELHLAAKAQALMQTPAFRDSLEQCRRSSQLDYRNVARLKLKVLRLIHDIFRSRADAERISRFDDFVREGGAALHNASLFQALRDHFGAASPEQAASYYWPAEYRNPQSPEVTAFARDHHDDIDFHDWLQWIADQQLAAASEAAKGAGMQVGLYRDLAVGCDRSGSEIWSSPTDYLAATEVGAPPDIFNPAGQNWGLPPFNPMALRAKGYQPFIDLVRSNMRHAGALRIDHVMGLMRLYCIPAGMPPSKGAYVSYPLDDLIGILALESHRNRCLVVGEDLGTVPPGFRERMADANILSYRVLFFEHDDKGRYHSAERYPCLAVAVAGNHDLATLQGWLDASDITLKDRLGLYPSKGETAAQHALRQRQRDELMRRLDLDGLQQPISAAEFADAVHRFLGHTASAVVLTQLDDLLCEGDQVNVPATSSEHPNWRRKYSALIESLTPHHPAWQLVTYLKQDGRGRRQVGETEGAPAAAS